MFKKLLAVSVMVLGLSVGMVAGGKNIAYADGSGSPVACNSNPNTNPNASNVLGSKAGTGSLVTVNVGATKVAVGVCIKSGSGMFDGVTHSGILGNGTYEDGCYQVAGVGTQIVTVTKLKGGNTCKDISHIDVITRAVVVVPPTDEPPVDEPEEPTVDEPEEPIVPTPVVPLIGGMGGGQIITPTVEVAAVETQVEAPVSGVNAGGGSVVAPIAVALAGSILSLGYGLARLKKFGL